MVLSEHLYVERKSTYKAAAVIEYNASQMDAPIVSVKGEELQADAIVQIARKFGIPIVERPEVTRTLSLVDEGTPIPEKLYKAVAIVLNELDKVLSHHKSLKT